MLTNNRMTRVFVFTLISLISLQVTIQIGEETREHNKFLSQLDSSADSVWGMLTDNMDHVKKLAKSGSNRLVFYLLAFAFFVIMVIYFITKSM